MGKIRFKDILSNFNRGDLVVGSIFAYIFYAASHVFFKRNLLRTQKLARLNGDEIFNT